jgi:hypothetical protein
MRKLILTGLIVLSASCIFAQTKAITETGDEVILNQDGTWKYVKETIVTNRAIQVNDKEFLKDKNSTFLVKSKTINIGIWLNPKEWNFSKNTVNESAEFQFQKKDEDLYGMLISEKMQIPVETLKDIALENAKKAAPDIKVIKEEYRNVNGIKVLMMQLSGTMQGIKFVYYGYYYSNSNGTIQLVTYTGENLLDEYKDDIELFINGLVEI